MARMPYSRREAIARARGFPVAYEDKSGRTIRPRSAFNQWRVTAPMSTPFPTRRTQLGDGDEIVTTRSEQALMQAIRRAERLDAIITALVSYREDPEDGSHPRTWPMKRVELWQHGPDGAPGYRATSAADAIGDGFAFGLLKDSLDAMEKYPGVVISVQLRIVT